ncbi:hypothetical protein [Jiangella muralis]|uniref:hypothetical protein n=1 Tax=Jiangella muralis TaxID=702383 RepID=UPI0012F8156D|nr:hypothetical protein [Jiangella muralis]
MIEKIETPAATARVTWRSPHEGGRKSGPPSAPVYAANCAFPIGGETELDPGWPATAEKFSLLLQRIAESPAGEWECKLDFLARNLVKQYLQPGAVMLVMEGPTVVGKAIISDVFLDVDWTEAQ